MYEGFNIAEVPLTRESRQDAQSTARHHTALEDRPKKPNLVVCDAGAGVKASLALSEETGR